MIWLTLLIVFGLFLRGPGGRHDWMRFHADQVPCLKIGCYGNLLWYDKAKLTVRCDMCGRTYFLSEDK